jgi:glycosyltransferase involved in cell wall biosynthesis
VRLLRERRPDVLQTWLYHADLMGLAAAALSGVDTVVWNIRASNLDLSHSRVQSRWTRWACARLSARPRAVVVNANAGRVAHHALGYRPREWVVIPNGVDVQSFRPDPAARVAVRAELGIPADAPVVGLIARWDPAKDHRTFLAAATRLAATRPDARFVLVGEGVTLANPDLAALAARLAPHLDPLALGRRDDVARIAAAFDVATCSSTSEGFPHAVVESMACGVPCVVTDVGDAADIVGDTGIVVPPRDPTALAGAWADLLGAEAHVRAALGEGARARVVARYTLERMVDAYERLYERLS